MAPQDQLGSGTVRVGNVSKLKYASTMNFEDTKKAMDKNEEVSWVKGHASLLKSFAIDYDLSLQST